MASAVQIPGDLKEKFPDLINLILSSQSMNDEERQYWINILPIMTPEQIANLLGILENEKRQLAEIDRKYSSKVSEARKQEPEGTSEKDRIAKRSELLEKEQKFEKHDEEQTEDLLQRIENL